MNLSVSNGEFSRRWFYIGVISLLFVTLSASATSIRDVSESPRDYVGEEVSEKLVDDVAEFLVDQEIFSRDRARRGADSVVAFLGTVLPFLDTSLCAVEID